MDDKLNGRYVDLFGVICPQGRGIFERRTKREDFEPQERQAIFRQTLREVLGQLALNLSQDPTHLGELFTFSKVEYAPEANSDRASVFIPGIVWAVVAYHPKSNSTYTKIPAQIRAGIRVSNPTDSEGIVRPSDQMTDLLQSIGYSLDSSFPELFVQRGLQIGLT